MLLGDLAATKIIRVNNLMLGIRSLRSPLSASGSVHNEVCSHGGVSGRDSDRYTAISNHGKNEKMVNSMSSSIIVNVSIFISKSEAEITKTTAFQYT